MISEPRDNQQALEQFCSQPVSEPRRSKRGFGLNYHVYNVQEDSITLDEAFSSLDSDLWKEAINDEMDFLTTNKT